MDKETLSNYGWIVICVLVLAVMIALAGPFGTFVAGAVKSTTTGLFGVNQNALGAAGITIDDQAFADGGNGGAGDQGGTNTLPEIGKTAEEYTWAEIKAISEASKGDEYFILGDTKTFTTSDGASVVMEIVAFNADTKADGTGTAGITWISKDIFATHVMNSPDNNTGGWEVSEMRRWLKSDAYNTLPTELKSAITTVNKTYYDKTTNSTLGCSDSVWIPSYREVFGTDDFETSGTTYISYFTGSDSQVKKYTGSATAWWLRSAYKDNSIAFKNVHPYSDNSANHSDYPCGVVLGFCT